MSLQEARQFAERQQVVNKGLVFGFHTDMTRREVVARIAQLAHLKKVELPLPSGTKLEVTSFLPAFAQDTLAELSLYFYRFQPADYSSLHDLLASRYKQAGYSHRFIYDGEAAGDMTSWVEGPFEIQLIHTEFWLAVLYLDLRREQQYLREAKQEEVKQRQEMSRRYRRGPLPTQERLHNQDSWSQKN